MKTSAIARGRSSILRTLCCVLMCMASACWQATRAETGGASGAPAADATTSPGEQDPSAASGPVAVPPDDPAADARSGQPSVVASKPVLSAEQTLELLLDAKFQSMLPEEAKKKLAQVGEVSEKRFESSGAVDLHMVAPGAQFVVEYVFDSARRAWLFSAATARASTAEANAAAALYREHEQLLRKRFGTPAWAADDGGEPVAGWSVGEAGMEVSLRQQRGERGEFGVRLHYGEVQGDAE